MKKISIVGAGPGGLAAGIKLAKEGHDVTIYEKHHQVGGRNSNRVYNGYSFDVGPTFLGMPYIFEELFASVDLKLSDYVDLIKLDNLYDLYFPDKRKLTLSPNTEKNKEEISRVFSSESADSYEQYYKVLEEQFNALEPVLRNPMHRLSDIAKLSTFKVIKELRYPMSTQGLIQKYIEDEVLALAFNFQTKYLGMSAWKTPAGFAMLSYTEHKFGLCHIKGGINQLSKGMAKAFIDLGGKIEYNTPVKKVVMENKVAKSIILEDERVITADYTVINADFGYAMTELFDDGDIKKYTKEKLMNKKWSCSTVVVHLSLDTLFTDLNHHTLVFSNDYQQYVEEVANHQHSIEDISLYIHNPSVTDDTIAPKGHSSVYLLTPVTNNKGNVNWELETEELKDKMLEKFVETTGLDIHKHIIDINYVTPITWVEDYNNFLGANFNLAHNLSQMAIMRPHNLLNGTKNVYLVGGGTHPGSGLPTIVESGKISANLIIEDINK